MHRPLIALIVLALGCHPPLEEDAEAVDTGSPPVDDTGPEDTPAPDLPTVDNACREPVEVEVTWVTDGDTFEARGPDGEETVRIIGVDTPETSWTEDCYGPEVKDYSIERLYGRKVWLSFDGDCDDGYDRTLAYVYIVHDDGSVERYEDTLLELGYARTLSISPNDSLEDHFSQLLVEAQEAGVGMWGACPTTAGVQLGHFDGEVTVPKLTVTSPPVADGYGFYVQDPSGGPWSGLFVYTGETVADVEVGDQLTVSGEIQEYYGATQLVASSWERTDDDWVERSWLDGEQADWEPWDGVLVKAYDLTVTATTEDGWETDIGLLIDETFTTVQLEPGDVLDVAGIVHTAWSSWRLSPRDADDLD